jgi:hypothetical protein
MLREKSVFQEPTDITRLLIASPIVPLILPFAAVRCLLDIFRQ